MKSLPIALVVTIICAGTRAASAAGTGISGIGDRSAVASGHGVVMSEGTSHGNASGVSIGSISTSTPVAAVGRSALQYNNTTGGRTSVGAISPPSPSNTAISGYTHVGGKSGGSAEPGGIGS